MMMILYVMLLVLVHEILAYYHYRLVERGTGILQVAWRMAQSAQRMMHTCLAKSQYYQYYQRLFLGFWILDLLW